MPFEFTQVDAFAEQAFSGNPAAVFQLSSWPDDGFLQNVALEMNLSETAFVVREEGGIRLRWFTPTSEVDLCGHATLATAHALLEGGDATAMLAFETRSGRLEVRRDDDGMLSMDFPAEPARQRPLPENIEQMVGAPVSWFGENRMDALVEVEEPGWVRSLDPDLSAIGRMPWRGLIVTAPSDREGIDFISRFFGPAVGVPEDPVTGSAHCALGPYWSARLGRKALTGYQASARGGLVHVEDRGDRVTLSGRAVTVIRGVLEVPLPWQSAGYQPGTSWNPK
jgi:predicted PhzF superfamily epimerase YddE/YHI9